MRELPLRTALFATAVAAAVLLYLLWWTTYAGIHFDDRYVQQPAGAAGEVGGTSIRLLSVTRSDLLADQTAGGVPRQASPGTIWVVAKLEAVQQPGASQFYCAFELIGPEGRRWERQWQVGRTLPACIPEETRPEAPVPLETVFLVPERFADQLVGVALPDPTVADRVPVITPPA